MAFTLVVKRSKVSRTATIGSRIALLSLVTIVGTSCSKTATPSACLQFSSDLMPTFAAGLKNKDFRLANAWAVKSPQPVDSTGVKLLAYFLSADIIAPSGEAVVGTWLTTEVTKPGLMFSVSPQAKKYSNWALAGDPSTAGITMETEGAKASVSCVLNGRAGTPK